MIKSTWDRKGRRADIFTEWLWLIKTGSLSSPCFILYTDSRLGPMILNLLSIDRNRAETFNTNVSHYREILNLKKCYIIKQNNRKNQKPEVYLMVQPRLSLQGLTECWSSGWESAFKKVSGTVQEAYLQRLTLCIPCILKQTQWKHLIHIVELEVSVWNIWEALTSWDFLLPL